MITREHLNQILIALGIAVPLVLAGFGAEWIISGMNATIVAHGRDILHLQEEFTQARLDQLRHDADESAATERQAHQLDVLQATWDLLKEQPRFKPGRFSR
jgi:hypothetical protein